MYTSVPSIRELKGDGMTPFTSIDLLALGMTDKLRTRASAIIYCPVDNECMAPPSGNIVVYYGSSGWVWSRRNVVQVQATEGKLGVLQESSERCNLETGHVWGGVDNTNTRMAS